MPIWNVLKTFGIFYNHLVHFVFIWYILSGFGIMYQEISGNPGSHRLAVIVVITIRRTLRSRQCTIWTAANLTCYANPLRLAFLVAISRERKYFSADRGPLSNGMQSTLPQSSRGCHFPSILRHFAHKNECKIDSNRPKIMKGLTFDNC
jgi:hypothetical protein